VTGSNRRPPRCKRGALPAELTARARNRLTALAGARLLPVRDEAEDVAALGLGELERLDEAPQLPRIVVRNCRFDSLANSLTLGELPSDPTE
jgi:hypothetical protein